MKVLQTLQFKTSILTLRDDMMLSSKVIGRDSAKQQHPRTQPGGKNYYSGSCYPSGGRETDSPESQCHFSTLFSEPAQGLVDTLRSVDV